MQQPPPASGSPLAIGAFPRGRGPELFDWFDGNNSNHRQARARYACCGSASLFASNYSTASSSCAPGRSHACMPCAGTHACHAAASRLAVALREGWLARRLHARSQPTRLPLQRYSVTSSSCVRGAAGSPQDEPVRLADTTAAIATQSLPQAACRARPPDMGREMDRELGRVFHWTE